MSKLVLLDAEPLGLLANPVASKKVASCRTWADGLAAAGCTLLVPEITDYEVRRELIRLARLLSIRLLDSLAVRYTYLPVTTAAMRKAAELWAVARQQGWPTAPDPALDADVILAAQALTLGDPTAVIATGNPGHLRRYAPAEPWAAVAP